MVLKCEENPFFTSSPVILDVQYEPKSEPHRTRDWKINSCQKNLLSSPAPKINKKVSESKTATLATSVEFYAESIFLKISCSVSDLSHDAIGRHFDQVD